ncbi:MAG: hypothetical protein WC061_08535, partial [Melioribacteraceae bacterium]
MANAINWFEIPVVDIDRAQKFYSNVFSIQMQRMDFGPVKMATFPMDSGGVSGSLCQGDWYKPSSEGVIIYLNGGE